MPIKNYVTGEVPYLTSYEPFTLPDGISYVDYINQMISYDLQPLQTPTNVTYFIGAETSYVAKLSLKNLTENATIVGTLNFNKDVFFVYDEFGTYMSGINKIDFSLVPEKTTSFQVEINKQVLDSTVLTAPISTLINITVKNVTTNGLVLKKINQTSLAESSFPQNITIK